jgi:hypothetical protein
MAIFSPAAKQAEERKLHEVSSRRLDITGNLDLELIISILTRSGQAFQDGSRDEDGLPTKSPGKGEQAQDFRRGALRASQGDEGRVGQAEDGARGQEEEDRERSTAYARQVWHRKFGGLTLALIRTID